MLGVALLTVSSTVKAFRARCTEPWTPHGIDPVIRVNPNLPTVSRDWPERLSSASSQFLCVLRVQFRLLRL
jgi:hypothetical protein